MTMMIFIILATNTLNTIHRLTTNCYTLPPSLREDASFFEYNWDFRFRNFTSSVLFPNFKRDLMFSIRNHCLISAPHSCPVRLNKTEVF